MSTMQKHECPTEIQALWNAAEKIGFSDFLWMPEHNALMASLPNAHLEDDRLPITWDMYEMQVQQNRIDFVRNIDTFQDSIVIIERIKLRLWLEAFYIPSEVACWVARNLPAWALPLMLYSWLKKKEADIRDWIDSNG